MMKTTLSDHTEPLDATELIERDHSVEEWAEIFKGRINDIKESLDILSGVIKEIEGNKKAD